jgi:predicted amidophosphoribosyltransferase
MAQALVCTSCGTPHGLEERFCPECGLPLVHSPEIAAAAPPLTPARERARKVRASYSEGPLVRVASARHQSEAELLQGMLLEEGIPSLLRRSAGFDVPDFLAAGPRDVLVPQSGAAAAREALGVPAPGPGALPRRSTARTWVRALAAALAVFVVACVAAAVLSATVP